VKAQRDAAECRGTLRKVLMGKDGKNAVRVTTTLTRAQLEAIEHIANQNHVKVAWVVRQAVERLIEQAEGGPLLPLDWK
jgi:hypothetical protein